MPTIGQEIRVRRYDLRISQRKLAQEWNIDNTLLARIESGKRSPKSYASQIARFLEVDEYDLRQRIAEEELAALAGELYIPPEQIERSAERDRAIALRSLQRPAFNFPRDRDRIPQILGGLQVLYEEFLFSARVLTRERGKRIYAGLFPDGYYYHDTTNVIVVATEPVKKYRESISERTKTFHVLHELGHYQLQWSSAVHPNGKSNPRDEPLYCSSGDNSLPEQQANAYASAFLLPRHELSAWLDDGLRFNFKKNADEVCEQYFVERSWLEWRLRRLNIQSY